MIEILNISGTTIVNTDKDFYKLHDEWLKSLYENSHIGQKLSLSKEFQFKVLLGEFLSDEIYSYKDHPKATEEIKTLAETLSNKLGLYFDQALLLCLKSFDEKLPLKIKRGEIDKLDKAIKHGLGYLPNPQDFSEKFTSKYGIKIELRYEEQ